MKQLFILVAFVAVAAGGFFAWRHFHADSNGQSFRTTPIERGNLTATISATGTLMPEEVVDVGAQVVGKIKEFGRDRRDTTKSIDYNSEVETGDVLAKIDDALYDADLRQAKALVEQADGQYKQAKAQVTLARANIARAEADAEQFRARLTQNQLEWTRVQRLRLREGVISDSDYEVAKANFEAAKATVGSGMAAINQTKASLEDSQANVDRAFGVLNGAKAGELKAQINVDNCTIKSPVRGVIIERRVNVGQTVVAVQNAPSLFLIAKDLARIQVWSQVNEADVEQIRKGQKVSFTAEGRAGEVFKGEVVQVRLNANSTQNVVTYTVIINAVNSSEPLRSYKSANVTFQIAESKDVLKVANAGLRWQPRRELVAPEHQDELAALLRRRASPRAGSTEQDLGEGVLWVEVGKGLVRPVPVKTGLTDGTMTEVVADDPDQLKESDRVVIGLQQAKNGAGDDASPFAPKMFGGKKPER